MHQMVQEGDLWPSVMIRFEPHWCNSKITWANTVSGVLYVGTQSIMGLLILNMVGAVKLYWLSYALT